MRKGSCVGRSLVAEVVGPAGAGKTTLVEALRRRDPGIAIDVPVHRIEQVPLAAETLVRFGPAFLREPGRGRWFTPGEIRSMAYLDAWRRRVVEARSSQQTAIVFDHGPIFRLVTLRWFGPEITRSAVYRRWWERMLERWTRTLDLVICLDAPSEVLARRIHLRLRDHVVKGKSEDEVYRFLARYREGFEQLISAMQIEPGPRILRFDTEQESVERVIEAVCAVMPPARGQPARAVAAG
jgi:deoxyadenosine/deoxycytidine kinase